MEAARETSSLRWFHSRRLVPMASGMANTRSLFLRPEAPRLFMAEKPTAFGLHCAASTDRALGQSMCRPTAQFETSSVIVEGTTDHTLQTTYARPLRWRLLSRTSLGSHRAKKLRRRLIFCPDDQPCCPLNEIPDNVEAADHKLCTKSPASPRYSQMAASLTMGFNLRLAGTRCKHLHRTRLSEHDGHQSLRSGFKPG